MDYKNLSPFDKALLYRRNDLVAKASTHYYWTEDERFLLYKHDLYDGEKEYVLVNISDKTQQIVFTHPDVLANINETFSSELELLDMNIIKLTSDHVEASINEFYFKLYLDGTVERLEKEEVEAVEVGTSPDKEHQIYVSDYNLFLKNIESKSEKQLTFDGNERYKYGLAFPYMFQMLENENPSLETELYGQWSPNSKYFVTQVLDLEHAKRMPLIQSSPKNSNKPILYTPIYPCAGDELLPQAYVCVINIETMECKVLTDDNLEVVSYGGRTIFDVTSCWFSANGEKFYHVIEGRGELSMTLKEIDLKQGNSKVLIKKESERRLLNYFDVLEEKNLILNICDSSGWLHIYFYDLTTGQLINQVTNGDFATEDIKYIDKENEVIYFISYGNESANPYYENMYRVNFDGTDLTLLTQEKQFHQVSLSPNNTYFIDRFSTVSEPDKFILKELKTGNEVMKLKEADITLLKKLEWTPVEEFVAKARDGQTDIYCNIHRPSNFDPNKSYPVIEHIYAGAWGYLVPKSFSGNTKGCAYAPAYKGFQEQSIAELGFIVVTIDGLGTNCRGNEFQDYSYKQVQDSGLPDHIEAIRQMAQKYPYIDLERVGIFGASCGGYDSVNAMLTYPDFYKVGVSTSGVHDWTMDKAVYPEAFMGYPIEEYYEQSSNLNKVSNLKGKLLLGHGELDDNVNLANTLKLADELIKHDKDFEMFIMPNVGHGVIRNKYFEKKMWNFFINNL